MTARTRLCRAAAALAAAVLLAAPAAAHQQKKGDAPAAQGQGTMGQGTMGQGTMGQGMMGQGMGEMVKGMRLIMPKFDPARGRKLFAAKGCVACHSINGVGGHDATALDAHTMGARAMNPFDLAAKMWTMAPYMIAAQEEALGEQILFTGDELADIIAFIHSDEEQHRFSEADIPPEVRPLMHHSHGDEDGEDAHAEEIGHSHAAGEDDDDDHD